MNKIKNYLNRDVKEFNVKLLVISGVLFLFIVGLLSYKITINSSYALFVDTVNSTKTITFHYEPSRVVTFDPDGGTIPEGNFWTGSGNSATKEVTTGLTYGDLPIPTKEGYTFKGWNGKNLFNPDIMAITNTTHVSGTEEITFASGVYDRIMPIASWTPKINTNYSLVIQILQNSFNIQTTLNTDNRFYISQYNSGGTIAAGKTGTHVATFSTRSDFSSVTIGSLWFWTSNTVTGTFKAKLAVYEGTTSTEYEPYYITEDTKVVQDSNHTLKAIWEEVEETQTEP